MAWQGKGSFNKGFQLSIIDQRLTHDPLCPFRRERDDRIATLERELAEVKQECEWPRYKRLAEENGNAARALETKLDAVKRELADARRALATAQVRLSEISGRAWREDGGAYGYVVADAEIVGVIDELKSALAAREKGE